MSALDASSDNPRLALSAEAYPPTGRIVSTGGAAIHVHEEGPVDAPVVVLVHGASGNSRDFSFDLAPRLAKSFRVIAVDRPGHGHSPALHDRGESPAEQAAALNAVLSELGVGRAVIVGHSYGGAVAMAWALEHPDRVAGVVSLGGATMPWPGGLGPWYRIASSSVGGATVVPLISSFATRGLAERSVDAVFAPQDPPPGYLSYVGVGLTLRAETLRTNARQVNTLKPHVTAMAERYGGLRIPVEVVHGSEDDTVPLAVHGERMVALIPNARLTVLEGVGHMPHHADPEAAVAAITRVAGRAGLR